VTSFDTKFNREAQKNTMNRLVANFQLAVCCCRLWFTRLQFSNLRLLIAPIADCRTAGLLVSRANCLLPVADLSVAHCLLSIPVSGYKFQSQIFGKKVCDIFWTHARHPVESSLRRH